MLTLRRSGLVKVALGQTTMEEVLARNGSVGIAGKDADDGWNDAE